MRLRDVKGKRSSQGLNFGACDDLPVAEGLLVFDAGELGVYLPESRLR
jgi:hypothetical protein